MIYMPSIISHSIASKKQKSIVDNGYYVLLVRNIKQKDESFNERDDPLKLLSVIDNSSFQNLSSSK